MSGDRLRCFGQFGHLGPHRFQSGRFEGEPVGSCSAVLVRGDDRAWREATAVHLAPAPAVCPTCGDRLTDRTVINGAPAYCDTCDREVVNA